MAKPSKDILSAEYLILSQEQIATKYGTSRTTVRRWLKSYGIVQDKNSEVAKTKRVLATNKLWQNPEYKAKVSKAQLNNWQDPEFKNRMKASFDKPEFKSKMSTISKASWQDPRFKEYIKSLSTSEKMSQRAKIGWAMPEVRRRHSDRSRRLWLNPEYVKIRNTQEFSKNVSAGIKKKWSDLEYQAKCAVARANQSRSLTQPHVKVCELLTSLGVAFTVEKAIGPWVFDIFVESANLLIEVQGDYWHNQPRSVHSDTAKSTYIKEHFPQYQLHYIWEHECLTEGSVLAKLKYWLGLDKVEQVDYEFSQLKVDQVTDTKVADEFLYNWHYQHHGRHGFDVGAHLGDELICLARFTSPSRNEIATSLGYTQKQVLELARLVVHPKYQKKNLLSWFLARCERLVQQQYSDVVCLVSFADSTYNHTGAVYKASNWTLNRVVEPNYWYVDQAGWVMHKKTLWNHARSLKMTEADYAEKNGFTKVWGKEKYKFIKVLPERRRG